MNELLNKGELIGFEQFFPGEIFDFELAIDSLPEKYLLERCARISATLFGKEHNIIIQEDIFKIIVSNQLQSTLLPIIKEKRKLVNNEIMFFHHSCLMIMQKKILSQKALSIVLTDREKDMYLFKLLLHCNSEYLKIISASNSLLNEVTNDVKLYLSIVMDMAQSEFMCPDSRYYATQLLKCKEFFQFAEQDAILKDSLPTYLKNKSLLEWKEHIQILLNIYLPIATQKNTGYNNVVFNTDIPKTLISVRLFIETFVYNHNSVSLNSFQPSDIDLKLLRSYPVYQLSETLYIILFIKFFIDKFFNGLTFDFYKSVSSELNHKKFIDFKSYYSYEFTQMFLLNKIMPYLFEKYKVKCFPEDKIKRPKEYGDYIVALSNRLLLFELKDITIKAEVKYSYDIEQIKTELNKKLIEETGLKQIKNTLNLLNNREYDFINDYIKEKNITNLTVYPIVILSDSSLNARGVNYFINQRFKEMTEDQTFNFKLKGLIIIQLDFFILYKELIRDKSFDFINILEGYLRYVKSIKKKTFNAIGNVNLEALISFETYFENYISKRDIKFDGTRAFQELKEYSKEFQEKLHK